MANHWGFRTSGNGDEKVYSLIIIAFRWPWTWRYGVKKRMKNPYTQSFICLVVAKNLVTQLTFHSSRDSNSFGFYRQTLIMDFFSLPAPRLSSRYFFSANFQRSRRIGRNASAASNLLNKIINTYQGQRLLLLVCLEVYYLNFRIALVPKLGQTLAAKTWGAAVTIKKKNHMVQSNIQQYRRRNNVPTRNINYF